MPHLADGATLPPMTAPESISYLESLNTLVFCQKRLQMPRPWLVKLMTASLSQFFWIQTTSCESIFLRQGIKIIIYVLELTSSKLYKALKDNRNYVPRLLFKDYVLVRIIIFYCLSMCLNSERKERFADAIYCISFLC